MKPLRLFIATSLSEEVERYLGQIINDLRTHGGSIKWVKPSSIHVTLRFLGDSPETIVPQLSELIDDVTDERSAVTTSLSKLGAFPNLRRPRVFWVGLGDGVEPLGEMAQLLEHGVRELGFEPDNKKFKPHLTLGRVRRGGGIGDVPRAVESYRVDPTPVTFDVIRLYQSTLTPAGPIYNCLHESKLGGERFGG